MELIIIILLFVSILLFALSFFQKDRLKEVEKQVETLSMTLLQDVYQLKKKVQILEEELLISQNHPLPKNKSSEKSANLLKEVLHYYESGYTIKQIADLSTLTEDEVHSLLESYKESK